MMSLDTSPDASALQLDVYRRMSPAARLRIGLELTALSRRLLEDGVRRRHPEYDNQQVRVAFLRRWLGGDLFRRAYQGQPELDP
jgi:hypothetical protein